MHMYLPLVASLYFVIAPSWSLLQNNPCIYCSLYLVIAPSWSLLRKNPCIYCSLYFVIAPSWSLLWKNPCIYCSLYFVIASSWSLLRKNPCLCCWLVCCIHTWGGSTCAVCTVCDSELMGNVIRIFILLFWDAPLDVWCMTFTKVTHLPSTNSRPQSYTGTPCTTLG